MPIFDDVKRGKISTLKCPPLIFSTDSRLSPYWTLTDQHQYIDINIGRGKKQNEISALVLAIAISTHTHTQSTQTQTHKHTKLYLYNQPTVGIWQVWRFQVDSSCKKPWVVFVILFAVSTTIKIIFFPSLLAHWLQLGCSEQIISHCAQ